MSVGTRGRLIVVAGLALVLAVAMYITNFQPVHSQTANAFSVAYRPKANLLDTTSAAWQGVPNALKANDVQCNNVVPLPQQCWQQVGFVNVPLSAQYIALPNGGSIAGLRARAIYNGTQIAVWVQWDDQTKNINPVYKAAPGTNGMGNTYSDAVAVEFPLEDIPGKGAFRCMGQTDEHVNIWQWKAERDETQGGSVRTGSETHATMNYIGPGAGYLVDEKEDFPTSKAFYDDGTKQWNVIFVRDMAVSSKESGKSFEPNSVPNVGYTSVSTQIAFAVWDGGNGERLSKKAVSTWINFALDKGEVPAFDLSRTLQLLALFVGTVVIIIFGLRFFKPRGERTQA